MTAAAPGVLSEVEIFRHQSRITHHVLHMNVEGITHEESLIQPSPGGNCLNFVVGHLLWAYNGLLPLLGQEHVVDEGALARYARGAPPLRGPSEAMELGEILRAWDQVVERMDAGLAGLTPEVLDRPVPDSPTQDPNETVRTLLSTVCFHQSYHVGQTGVLRRIAGKPGAIA